jgi:glycosyltransferase involved in cell wall biosynthesis
MPKVSLIIITRNRARLLPRAIKSALKAGTDVEIIVVDDASVDNTAAVCRLFEGIKYIPLEIGQGMGGARNVGILASSADYVAFLDDDDVRLPGSLDAQVEALTNDDTVGFVCGAMVMADQAGNPTGEVNAPNAPGRDVFWDLLELNFPAMPLSVVIRKACFTRVGLFNTSLVTLEDWDLFVRIAELYPVLVLDQPVGIYTKPTAASGQSSSAQAQLLFAAARHQLQLFRLPRAQAATFERRKQVRRLALSHIADTLLWNATQALYEGEYKLAWRNALTALRLSPRRALRPKGYRRLGLILRERWRVKSPVRT